MDAPARKKELHIVCTRLQNIGDMLTFIPALRTLRLALPDACITVLAKHAGGVEVLRNCPYVDELLVVRGRGLREKLRLVRALRAHRPDYFIISPQDLGRVPWALMGGARHIAGYPRVYNYGRWQREKLPWLLDIAPHHDTLRTEVENCLRLVDDVLDELGVPLPGSERKRLEYSWYSTEDELRARDLLAGLGVALEAPYVVLAPFSKRAAKNWPMARWVELCGRIAAMWQAPIVVLGGEAESARANELAGATGDGVRVLAGRTTLAQSAVVLRQAGLCVGPDSGPAFLATAVGCPVVALYGPADYYRWHAPESSAPRRDIVHHVPCGPCRHQECPRTDPCIEAISVDEVWQACRELWGSDER
jgi:heptosyltransferase-1